MDDLDGLFERLSRLLDDRGVTFIAVPNSKRIQFNEKNGSLRDTPPNHIGRWSFAAFELIGARHGLRLVDQEIEPFSLLEFVKQDIAYSYLRRSQQVGTVENWSRSLKSSKYGRIIGAAIAALSAFRRLNVWRKAAMSDNLGGSLWVKFSKAPVVGPA